MATAIMMMMLVIIAFVAAPWIGEVNHAALHRIDLMAGGEGIE